MGMVYLDGKLVDDSVIEACKHRYLGMMRMPYRRPAGIYDAIVCPSGHTIWLLDGDKEHWAQGCYDVPQYVSL
jgi:hypothetical protein